MEKVMEKIMKSNFKRKQKITKALMIAFLINGGFSLAENNPITPGTNLGGENATAIGAGSVSAGSESSSIGTNTFASGNNMTKEEYLKFLKDNKERLAKIEAKMQEIKNDKDEIQKLRQEHDDIINKIDRVNSYKKAIEEKEKELNEKEPQILKTIEEKRTESIKFTKEIEDLENKLNMITKLRVDKLEEAKNENRINVIAQDLKHRMEDGTTFLKKEKEIPISEYENYLNSVIANTKKFYTYNKYENDNELKDVDVFYDKTKGLSPTAVPIIEGTNNKSFGNCLTCVDKYDGNYVDISSYYKVNHDDVIDSQMFYDNGKFKIAYNLKSDNKLQNKPVEPDDEQQIIENFLRYSDDDISYNSFMKYIKRNFEKQKLGIKDEDIKESYLNIDQKTYENKLKQIKYENDYNKNKNELENKYNYNHVEEIEHYVKIRSDVSYGTDVHGGFNIGAIQFETQIAENNPKKWVEEYKKMLLEHDSDWLKDATTKEEIYTQLFNITHNNNIKLKKQNDGQYIDDNINFADKMYLFKDDVVNNNDINYKAIDFVKPLANKIKKIENNINLRNIENNKKKCNDVSCLLTYTEYTPEEKQQIEEIKAKYKEFNNIINHSPLNENEFIELIYDIAKTKPTTDDYERRGNDAWWSVTGKQNATLLSIFTTWNFRKGIPDKEIMEKLKNEQNRRETIYESRKFVKVYQDEIDRLKRLERDANAFITEKEELIKGYKNDIENLKSLLNSEHPSDVEEVNKQIQEKEEKIKKALADIENLKKNLTEIKPGTNALAYGTNSAALGKDSIAFGTNNIAIKESSIAFGTNNFVSGNKSIAMGYGHKIIGDRSVALGDPNLIFGNDNFAIGNNIKIGTETQKVNNNLVFGSDVTIDGINNAIVFGNESKPIEGAVSFGNDTTTRQLKYIAKGTDDTDAVNFSQLKDYVKKNAKGKNVNIKNELISKLNYDPDTYLKIDETYLQYISGKKESPKIPSEKKLSLNIDGVKDALGKDSDIANPKDKFVTDQKVHDYVTTNFVSKDSLGVTSKNNYISVNTNGNKYELSFNKDELIKNLDLTKNNTIATINTTLDDKLDKADLSMTGDKYIGVKKDNKFNYTLSFNKTNLEKDLDLTNNSSINNMFTTKLGDINTNIGDLKTKVESNTNNINSLTTKVDDNSNKISDLTTKVETNTNNINSLTTKVNTNTKDITTLKKDMTNKLNVDADNLTTQGETNLTNKLSKGSDISNPKNRLVTDTKVKQYLDTNFKIQNYVVGKEVLDIKKDAVEAKEKAGLALGGVANAIAMANLTTTESGIANLTAAYGTYGKEHALAIGFNGTIPNKRFNYKLGLSTNMKGNLGIGAGIGIVLGKIDAQINKNINSKEIEQNKKIKDLEEKLKYMTDKLNDLTNKINDINFNENKKVETKPTKEETKETKLVIDDFDFDSYTLKEEQKQKLDKFFEKNDCKEIVIVGYTDNVGTDDYNLKLSEKRAKEVEKYLKAKNNNLEILTLGMGKGESLLKESKNDRRVEIFIQ